MPTPTYTLLDSVTLASSAASVTFSSLDTVAAGYQDLIIVGKELYATGSGAQLGVRFNGTGSHNYVYMYGSGSSASSSTSSGAGEFRLTPFNLDYYANEKTMLLLNVFDFAVTDKHKSILARVDKPLYGGTLAYAGRWADTSAVTSISLFTTSNFWASGVQFDLYGIEA